MLKAFSKLAIQYSGRDGVDIQEGEEYSTHMIFVCWKVFAPVFTTSHVQKPRDL